jgi:2'-5' RNA ligase
VRAFVALELSEPTKGLLERVRASIVEADAGWAGEKWVRRDHLHVTLAFMPHLPGAAVEGLEDRLRSGLRGLECGTIAIAGVAARPRAGAARMLWATFLDAEPIRPTAQAVAQACHDHVPEDTRRPFAPHVTLARVRGRRPILSSALAGADQVIASSGVAQTAVSVSRVSLFSSVLGRGGPTYDTLANVPIGSD